jgi:hypothetical protein
MGMLHFGAPIILTVFIVYELIRQEALSTFRGEDSLRAWPQWIDRSEYPFFYWWQITWHSGVTGFLWWYTRSR